ncbi:hypothetical protein JCM10213v2_008920 [Rhodosporidiobolus nylandii]
MASFPSYDDDLSSSVPLHTPGRALKSFAASFHEEDYEPAPAGIDQRDWARLARRQRVDHSESTADEGESLLDEAPTGHHSAGEGNSHDDDEQLRRYNQQRAQAGSRAQPRSRTSSHLSQRTAGSGGSGARFSNGAAGRAGGGAYDEQDTTLRSDANDEQEQSTSTEVDQTQTTEALSRRLAGDDTTVESSTVSDLYGGEGRAAKKRGSGGGVGQNMTLREQEKVIDELKKDNFSLKLKLHFYEQRLEKMAPSSVEQALRENIQLKVEFQTLRSELKKYKKLLLEGDKAIQNLTRERDDLAANARPAGKGTSAREREMEKELRMLRERDQEREEWERKARDLAREVKELRRNGGNQEEVEDLRADLSTLQHHLRDAEDERDELRADVAHLRGEIADQADQSMVSDAGRSRGAFRREVERLEELSAQLTMLAARNDEKQHLQHQVEDLKADLAALENELEHAQRARDASREERAGGERGDLEDELNAHRDRATSLELELEDAKTALDAKEREIEELIGELDDRQAQHEEELEAARRGEEEARQLLEDKEADIEDLANRVEQLMQQAQEKEAQYEVDREEMDALTHDLQKLGGQIYELEHELEDKEKEVSALRTDLDAVDKELEDKQEVHEQVVAALKEKLNTSKTRLSELTIQHESLSTENTFLSSKVEDLALANAKLEERTRADVGEKQRLQDEAEEIMRALKREEEEHDEDVREAERKRREFEGKWQREVEEMEQELKSTRANLTSLRALLAEREGDITSLQSALNGLESSTRRQGETTDSERFALELEMDRVKRDLKRVEGELEEANAQLEEREKEARAQALRLATAHSENKDLASQLASQTQSRLSLADKHEAVSKTLSQTQLELTSARDRLRSVEDQLSHDSRALGRQESEAREQLRERNQLLLMAWEGLAKVGGRKTSSTGSDPKPFDAKAFPAFHDRLVERLKAVGQLQHSFERRAGEIEKRVQDGLSALKRQADARHSQLDRFEASLKAAVDVQKQWRERVRVKQTELEGAKAEVADLKSQLLSLRRSSTALSASPDLTRSPSSLAASESALQQRLSLAQSRVSTLERRLAATQAQLKDAEDKLGEQRAKIGTAEGKWEARFRELEQRVRQAEEKTKRERQGAKERVAELMGTIKNLETSLNSAKRRDQQLDDVLRQQARPSSSASAAGRPGSRQAAEEGR